MKAEHQPGRGNEQQNEWSPDDEHCIRPRQLHGYPGDPEREWWMVEIAKGEVSRGGDVIGFAMTEVEHACSQQQSDAGSEAYCPRNERNGRVESDTRAPVGRAIECGRFLLHHELRQNPAQESSVLTSRLLFT